MHALTTLLARVQAGDRAAGEELFAAAYADLRRMARARLRDGGRNTVLDTTSLVHESYLRFLRTGELRAEDRPAFLAYASRVMRSVIVDSARERQAQRRGGDVAHLTLNTSLGGELGLGEDSILAIHDALQDLAKVDGRLAQVVEMRYFGGYDDAEIGEALGVTARTVQRDWEKARLLLATLLS
jgi:RNA polymerase sigma factor (TIGR02999 family)